MSEPTPQGFRLSLQQRRLWLAPGGAGAYLAQGAMLIDGELLEDLVWSYEAPYPAVQDLRDRLAFDASRVEVYEVDQDALDKRRHPHTDNPPPFANM